MKKLATAFAIAIVTITTLTGCGKKQTETVNSAETVSIVHEKGETKVPVGAKKVVVFELSVLDTMDALGIEAEFGLPSGLPSYMKSYEENATNVGSMKEANMEAIYEFQPDVIFISGRLADYYDELSKIAPTVYVTTGTDTYLEDVKSNVSNIVKIFGKAEEAEKQIELLEDKVASVKKVTEKSNEKGLILLANEGTLSAYGSGSRYGFIHDTLNVKCADEDITVSTHGQEASYEYISQKNPDVIFVIDRTTAVGGNTNSSETLNNALVNETSAAKAGKIISLDSEVWYLSPGGLNSTMKMVDEIAAAFAK